MLAQSHDIAKRADVARRKARIVLTLMKRGSHGTHPYPDHFHVGFFVADEARVDALHARMRGDGLDVAAPERSHAYSFYVKAPGGFLVEVGA